MADRIWLSVPIDSARSMPEARRSALRVAVSEGSLTITCSLGIAAFPADGDQPGRQDLPAHELGDLRPPPGLVQGQQRHGQGALQIDQLVRWALPVVLVARSGLGTLNHTLLSLEALRRRGLEVLGLVLNGPRHADNPRTLEQLGGVPVLCELPPLDPLDAAALQAQWQASALARTLQP